MKPAFYTFFLFFGLICTTAAGQQQVSCYWYHNGKFKILDTAHNSVIVIERLDSVETQYIYRTDSMQYDMKLVFKVEWLNDCTYKLYLVNNLIHTKRGDKHLPVNNRIFTNRIMETNEMSYLVYTNMNDKAGTKFANVIWKTQ